MSTATRDAKIAANFRLAGAIVHHISTWKPSGENTRYTVYFTLPNVSGPSHRYQSGTELNDSEVYNALDISYDGLAELTEYTENTDYLRLDLYRVAHTYLSKERRIHELQSSATNARESYGKIAAEIAVLDVKEDNDIFVSPNDYAETLVKLRRSRETLTETTLAYHNAEQSIYDQIGRWPDFAAFNAQYPNYRHYRRANRSY